MEAKRLMVLALLVAAAATAAAARGPAPRADDEAMPASIAPRGSSLRRGLLSICQMLGTCDTKAADLLTIRPGSGGGYSGSCLKSLCTPNHELIVKTGGNCRIHLCISYVETGRTGLKKGSQVACADLKNERVRLGKYVGNSFRPIDVDTDYSITYAYTTGDNGWFIRDPAEIKNHLKWTKRADPPCNEHCGCCFPYKMDASFNC